MSKNKIASDSLQAKGFFRLQVTEGDKVVGDSGWKSNVVTTLGKEQYLCRSLGSAAGSKYVSYAMLGMDTAAKSASQTALVSELTDALYSRMSVATSLTGASSNTIQFAFTLASGLVSTDRTIAEVGLINTDSAGTMFAGNTFASSNLATNQSVNGSYEIRFS
jgi:hypothetical protein